MKGFILILVLCFSILAPDASALTLNPPLDVPVVEPAVPPAVVEIIPEPAEPIKVLIVPGHDDDYSGAVYGDYSESYINLVLAEKIQQALTFDPTLDVTVARNRDGYIPELDKYFKDNKRQIEFFIKVHKRRTEKALDTGTIDPVGGVAHNDAPSIVAYRLYGINRWADEEGFDFVLHVHFNDEAGRRSDSPGKYSGYSIYVPSKELPNHVESLKLGDAVGARLKRSVYMSNLPVEKENASENGVIPDFKLIAVGSNGTLELPSILVEYSYIFEPTVSPKFLDLSTGIMAEATALGIREYVSGIKIEDNNLKYNWTNELMEEKEPRIETMALQYALHELGIYPPDEKGREGCPVIGIFGPCTKQAVKDFQVSQGLKADGVAGAHTLGVLNYLFK